MKRFKEKSVADEEALRRDILEEAVRSGIQLIQLPCPEFILYGSRRWGHTREQFDNIFYRQRCRELLRPVIDELKEYLSRPEEFQVLGILGIDGSPSCGVRYTCSGDWGGEFSGREIDGVLKTAHLADGKGVLMEVFAEMLRENEIALPMDGLFARERDRAFALLSGSSMLLAEPSAPRASFLHGWPS